jgi:large repetitive protein
MDALLAQRAFIWSLSGPAGIEVDSRTLSDDGSYTYGSTSQLLRLIPGAYTLTVSGSSDEVGDYAFRLLNVSDTSTLTPGALQSGSLNPANRTDVYRSLTRMARASLQQISAMTCNTLCNLQALIRC